MGGGEAAVDRGGGGGSAAGRRGPGEDPLHLSLPHRCLLLGGQGQIFIISPIAVFSIRISDMVGVSPCRARLPFSLEF